MNRYSAFHVHKSAIKENDFKEHVNFYTGSAPSDDFVTLYTTPPKREWVWLTDQDYEEIMKEKTYWYEVAKAVELKSKEKNHET